MLNVEGEPLVIGIVGPTGSGKSTLAKELGKLLDLPVEEELPKNNPFLDEYYEDIDEGRRPSSVALQSQLFFLEESISQARKIEKRIEDENIGGIWDVTPPGHRMYAELATKNGIMSEEDWWEYIGIYNQTVPHIIEPDVSLLVTSDLDTLYRRIQDRAKEEESRRSEINVDPGYWLVQIEYWIWMRKMDVIKNLIEVDSGKLDWLNGNGAEEVWAMAMPLLGLSQE